MSAPSPLDSASSQVALRLSVNGNELDTDYPVVSVEVWAGVNRIPRARIVVLDGDPTAANFPISEGSTLIPGAMVSVALGYGDAAIQVFSGVIFRQSLEISQAGGGSRLVIEATDRAMAMTLARKNAVFENMSKSEVIASLVGQAGLTANVTNTSPVQTSIIQYDASDWDMMVMCAQNCGMVVSVADGRVTASTPDMGGTPVLALTYGESITEFHADMDAATQYAAEAIRSYAWDPASQALAVSEKSSASENGLGNLSSEELAKVFGIPELSQQTAGSLNHADLTEWSTATLLKSRLAKIRGEVSFQGSALVTPGCTVELCGLGDRFNGIAYVSAVRHTVADGGWTTQVEIGLSPKWFEAPDIASPAAAGLLPPVANLQTGIVRKIDGDPNGEFRVKVELPLLRHAGVGLWARLASPYASDQAGVVFYPEIGDEVVIAFMNGDPRFPVIVGSLYSKSRPPKVAPEADNRHKSITTRAGLRIDFFDDDKVIEISTPQQQCIRFDDMSGQVDIRDKSGSRVTMASSGVTIESAAGITLKAVTDVKISAKGMVSIVGDAGIDLAGLAIQANAGTSFAAQGGAEAKLTSNGMVTVEGSMVKIN